MQLFFFNSHTLHSDNSFPALVSTPIHISSLADPLLCHFCSEKKKKVEISKKYSKTRYNMTRYKPLQQGYIRQPRRRKWVPRAGKELETTAFLLLGVPQNPEAKQPHHAWREPIHTGFQIAMQPFKIVAALTLGTDVYFQIFLFSFEIII